MKRIIICADDYGQNPTISQAIVGLLQNNRISATSCLVTSPLWAEAALALKPLKNNADIGLHFNLTEGNPRSTSLTSFWPLKQLIIKSQLRQLDKAAIAAELHAQLDVFLKELGTYPDFIDGHQHIHQFPIIRDALLDVYEERLRQHNIYLRCTYHSGDLFKFPNIGYSKRLIISLCGGIAFKQALLKRKIPHNTTFAGIYLFTNANTYATLFPQFLNESNDRGLIMCHPGLPSNDLKDEIAIPREYEYQFLASADYLDLLKLHQIKLSRFQTL